MSHLGTDDSTVDYDDVDEDYNYNSYDDTDTLSSTDDDSSEESTSSYQATYVGSVNSDKFHEPSCSHAKRIKEGNKITFSSRQEAIDAGYSPCGVCYP